MSNGILAVLAARLAAGEPLISDEERARTTRAAFDAALERQLWTNPANCILPDNPFTEH
jgi:hypothetical protein